MQVFNILFPLVGLIVLIHFTPANGVAGPLRRPRPPFIWSKAALTYNNGHVLLTSQHGRDISLKPGLGGVTKIWNAKFYAVCNKGKTGVVRSFFGKLQVCNGYFFVNIGSKLGSRGNPARSCKEILDDDWSAPNGAYYLHFGSQVTRVFCLMRAPPRCQGKGFTMIMKINGHKTTFTYKSKYWTNKASYNPSAGATGFDHRETKLPTYWSLSFTRLCLAMKTRRGLRFLGLPKGASSLYSLIHDGRYRPTSLGRNAWKSLIPDSSLQRNCNKEGFNAFHKGQMARIGIIANQENDCRTPDSRVAFGGSGGYCGTDKKNSCGNEARCNGDNGNKSIKVFGYIFAQ